MINTMQNNVLALEANVLGTIMKYNYLLEDVQLQTEYFTTQAHKSLFETFKQLKATNTPIDVATVLISSLNSLDANELMFIANQANERNFDKHVQLLFEQHQDREKQNILRQSLEDDLEINEIVKALQSIETNKASDYHSMSSLLADALERPFQPQEQVTAHKTGLKVFDAITGGLRNSELIILAARPSVGKTAVALNLMRYLTQMNQNIIPVFFSLEMNAASITNRLIASCGRYDSRKLDNPYAKLTDDEKARWNQSLEAVRAINLETFDSAAQTMSDIRRKTRKMSRIHKDKQLVVVIDYLQIIRAENRNMSEYERITSISKELKELAKEFDIPVVCLAQLNRGNEGRNDKRPMMSDLRGSGAVEQDADIVGLLHREDYYEQDTANHNNEIEINVAKNRNSKTGLVTMYFDRTTQTIMDK